MCDDVRCRSRRGSRGTRTARLSFSAAGASHGQGEARGPGMVREQSVGGLAQRPGPGPRKRKIRQKLRRNYGITRSLRKLFIQNTEVLRKTVHLKGWDVLYSNSECYIATFNNYITCYITMVT